MEFQRSLEQQRFRVLHWIYERTDANPQVEVTGAEIASALSIPRAKLYQMVEYLDGAGLLYYCGAGPRVRITQHGIDEVLLARRRRSIRE